MSIHDNLSKNIYIKIPKNSGISLRQSNYEIQRGLTKEQVNAKKESTKIPDGPSAFKIDSIDEMIEYENKLVFNQEKNYHDPYCKESMRAADDSKCCQAQIKIFNRCNKKSYTDQELELPLILGQDRFNYQQNDAENFDIMS